MTSQPTPHPLKGITCTNDDPDSCALCLEQISGESFETLALTDTGPYVLECCGKRVCSKCYLQNNCRGKSGSLKCMLCPMRYSLESKEIAAVLKKHAKKGRAWAQYLLGTYSEERGDYFQAVHFYRLAVEKGHPCAMIFLSDRLYQGNGCSRDLDKAIGLLDQVQSIAPILKTWWVRGYSEIASIYRKLHTEEGNEKALSILLPLAEGGHHSSQVRCDFIYEEIGDLSSSRKWSTEAIFSCDVPANRKIAPLRALQMNWRLSDLPQAKVVADVVKWRRFLDSVPGEPEFLRPKRLYIIIDIRRTLLGLRRVCAGCDKSLDRTTRKLCKGCKTYCYCSADCQKKHWHDDDDGHRAECKGAQALKKRMKDENLVEKWINKE